jgi:S1-C subfamily serine protease
MLGRMPERRPLVPVSRETRLLAATLVVSVVVLLVLARFRFPSTEDSAASPTAQPLARLAARATYDELASIIAQLESRVAGSLLVVRVGPIDTRDDVQRRLWPAAPLDFPRFVPALRIRHDHAVALLPPGAQIQSMVGATEVPSIVAVDNIRGLSLLRVPPSSAPVVTVWDSDTPLDTPRYVAVAEGSRGGPTLRPFFLGRTDAIGDPRWDTSLMVMAGTTPAQVGSLVYALHGDLAGIIADTEGGLALVPAEALMSAADQLTRGSAEPAGDIGITAQPLTPSLSTATGANYGAVVSYVEPGSPAEGRVSVGDVIWAIDGELIYSIEGLSIRLARAKPGAAVQLTLTRRGKRVDVPVRIRARDGGVSRSVDSELGITLRAVDGLGSEVMRLAPRGGAARAGLAPGDLITHLGDAKAPGPAEVSRAYRNAPAGTALVVGVERQGTHLVLALEKP